ncbi:sodium:calcium antiporter [Candidatus Micrarchaeota archaeon]|nr:sodium:calcium antiporter [Candidatus Micrarchaeota archaeon]
MESMVYGAASVLALSIAFLFKSSDWAIENAVVIARYFRLSEMATGFLLFSVATSLPELVVSLIASAQNQVGISVGNVIGSNIADLGLVLGASALFGVILIIKGDLVTLTKIVFLSSFLPLIMLFPISPFIGVVLLLVFVWFAYFSLNSRLSPQTSMERPRVDAALRCSSYFLISVVVLLVSSHFAVDSAVRLATLLGISKAFMGATIIAVGTSLPELAVNISAMKRKKTGIAVGNVLGSCIVNLTLVLGLASIINPLAANMGAFFNLVVFLLIINAVLLYFVQRKKKLGFNEGIVLLGLYVIFLLSSILIELKF